MGDLPRRWLPRAAATGRVVGQLARTLARHAVRPDVASERALGDAIVVDLDRLKGLAMKVGQILSYMDVGLPDETSAALARLQTGVKGMDFAEVEAVVAASLGAPVDQLFEGFERAPVAAASIGQVHRARVGGVPVAVKVRYPHVRDTLAGDLAHVRPLAALASLATAVDGAALVEELRARLLEECDYRREQRAQEAAARALLGDTALRVPATLPDRCGDAVLTTAWMPGAAFADLLAGPPDERNGAAVTLARFPWTTLFGHGFLHADPHPGNFLFPGGGEVTVLDWGSVRHFVPDEVEPFRTLIVSVLDGNRAHFRDAVVACGLAPRPDKFDFDAAWEMFSWLYAPYRGTSFHFDRAWWLAGRRWTGPANPNQRHQGMPAAWIWLLRVQWGLGAVLVRLEAEGDFGRGLREAVEGR
jgi:predicted unusual protein kinase regulating ubiquinone biosynthesis (AarF/ABC1/UbiB family)